MITLDRAIELMEAQVGELSGVTGVVLFADDILHYLREYKERQENLETYQFEQNRPLTWEQLQGMARKPVWIEWKNPRRISRWWIVDLNEKPDSTDKLIAITTSGTRREWLYKPEQGDIWQAYRKERG